MERALRNAIPRKMKFALEEAAAELKLWPLDPAITFLNHGSFGSCPSAILEYQTELRQRLEAEPVQFFVKKLEPLLDEARQALSQFVGCDADDLVFVPNATGGVNSVLRSLEFSPEDELLVTNQEYNACRNAMNFIAERTGAKVVIADIPFPIKSPQQAVDGVLEKVTPRTRLVLIDHVTSQTGMVLPLAEIVSKLNERGIPSLVDAAHAPGMIPLNLRELNATYYTGNCHKWMCSPKSAALLYVSKREQPKIRPLTISHGANTTRKDRSRYQIEFGWMGTSDPTAALCLPKVISYMEKLVEGGWPGIMERNRALALAARELLCQAVGTSIPCPVSMVGSLAAIPLPPQQASEGPSSPLYGDPQQDLLYSKYKIEVPFVPWGPPGHRVFRVSAQLYNKLDDYRKLAGALKEIGI